jgi:hypothetical protein
LSSVTFHPFSLAAGLSEVTNWSQTPPETGFESARNKMVRIIKRPFCISKNRFHWCRSRISRDFSFRSASLETENNTFIVRTLYIMHAYYSTRPKY